MGLRYFLLYLLTVGGCAGKTAFSQMPVFVYVDRQGTAGERQAISQMVFYLRQISTNKIEIDSTGTFKESGIYLTTIDRDRYRKAPASLKNVGPEGSYIKGTGKFVYIVGTTSLALQEGIYLYLNSLGFRFYAPHPSWHIIPAKKNIFISIDKIEKPDLAHRRLLMAWGFGDEEVKSQFLKWQQLNCMPGSFEVNNGHAYIYMLMDYKKEFEKNPALLTKPLLNGQRQQNSVFNYSSPQLADLAYRWVAEDFDRQRQAGAPMDMKSLEPFDGENLCTLPACMKIGRTASDQIFYFTNQVAQKLKKTHPDKKIGMLAYSDHIDIPRSSIEKNIFVTLTNGYNTTTYSIDELIERWKTKVDKLGIYDYLGTYGGSSAELPGKDAGARYREVASSVKNFIDKGVVAYQAETTNGWIAKGLSHYLIAKIAWNKNADVKALVNEYFRDCFRQSEKPVRQIFDSWNSNYLITDDDVFAWFNSLRNAFNSCTDPAELERLNQVALYLYYVKMYKEFSGLTGDAARQKGIGICAFANKVMGLGIIPSQAIISTVPDRLGPEYSNNNTAAVWKSMTLRYPSGKKEWLGFIDSYIGGLRTTKSVNEYAIPPYLSDAALKKVPTKFTWINPRPEMSFSGLMASVVDTRNVPKDSLYVVIRGGTYKKAGKVGVKVYLWNNSFNPNGNPVLQQMFAADGSDHQISLANLPRTKYLLLFTDDGTLGYVYFPKKLKFCISASRENPILGGFSNAFYFYVPPETKRFYIVKTHYMQVYSPTDKQIISGADENVLDINLEKYETGWWKVYLQREEFHLIGIPPIVSRDPDSFLFP